MSRKNKKGKYAQRSRDREERHKLRSGRQKYDRYGLNNGERSVFNGEREESNRGWNRFKEEQMSLMPARLPKDPNKTHISVFVEGYEDVAFWRGIFDAYESDTHTFEIGVPPREDLAKGKKVLMNMLEESSPTKLLCVDSDFDYLFGEHTDQSKLITTSSYMFHTYAYSTENFLCYAPSLHNVCVKATKNDTRIFDFETFFAEYSKRIYPLFLWYAYSAQLETQNVFTLIEFKSSVKLNYLEVEDNGQGTLDWLERQVRKRLEILHRNHPGWDEELKEFENRLLRRGLTPETVYLYMQGHTLMDNVVIVMLNAVCEQLKLMSNIRISTSTKTGVALKNEMSNYNNALRNVRDILLDNEGYKECFLYKKLEKDIENYLTGLK